VFVCALLIVSLGCMVGFTTTGAIDSMSSDAAQTINATATSFSIFAPVAIVIVALIIVGMIMLGTRAF